ncbi:hypothetical protein AAFF_G00012970 [Aldrovandia affinis]|uniref:H15 domain-containing protein n=1 Tax=Aldrovandia affinis TaxID=143900 RepID=A0AAD7WI77_9TELE|nr:hypothetical protein AAFF_G00012970 [Aldrovandia affinis]
MVEVAPVPAAAQAKTTKKKPVAKAKKPGPSVSDLILEAVAASKDRKGISFSALKKILIADGYNIEANNNRVKFALKALLKKGALQQTKGCGASGSFRVPPETKKPAKKATNQPPVKKTPVKKPAAKKEKVVAAAARKPAAKTTVKKATVTKKVTLGQKKAKKTVPKKAKSTTPKRTKSARGKLPAKKAPKAKTTPKKKKK